MPIFKTGDIIDVSKFEAVNSTWLSSCQRHVRPIFEMKWRPRASSRVTSGDSDILSSCEMKYEPAFKPLQGNLDFFLIRASRGPFRLEA